jgi:glyoxylase-like metal-dependent hydrolase (beta-lactamase superfamily II)
MTYLVRLSALVLSLILSDLSAFAADDGISVDRAQYTNRQTIPDFTAAVCPDNPRGLEQIKGNLYRHTTGPGLAVHSGLVLVTKEGALVIDPAMTCTSTWLRDEIKRRFNIPVAYVVYTHAHADHILGSQVLQNGGAIVVANQRAIEPIVGEKIPTAIPDRVFDTDMTINLGGETVKLHRVAPSHSDSMVMVQFPSYKALQCTDVCESKSMPYNDFLDFYYDGWVETLDWVIKQDVEIIDVVDLHWQVLDLERAGQTWDQLYRNVKFSEEVQKWTGFSTMKTLNILGMYRWVTNHRRGEW